MSDSSWPHGLQNTRLPYPSLSPGVCSNSCSLSWWCYPTISSSVTSFSSCPQYFPASAMNFWDRASKLGPYVRVLQAPRSLALPCAPWMVGTSLGRTTLPVHPRAGGLSCVEATKRASDLSPLSPPQPSVPSAAVRWGAYAAETVLSKGCARHTEGRAWGASRPLREVSRRMYLLLNSPAVLPELSHAPHSLHLDLADCKPRGQARKGSVLKSWPERGKNYTWVPTSCGP